MKGFGLVFAGMVVLVGLVVAAPGSSEAAFVYACTPVSLPNTGNGASQAILSIYNPNTQAVNVAAKWLTKGGVNLSGATVPNGGGAIYPGQTGANTVSIAAGNTQVTAYAVGDANAALDLEPATIRIVSDLPVNVGWAFGQNLFFTCAESL